MIYIYPYRVGSASVNAMKEALQAKSIKLADTKFKGSPDKNVVNWGNSTPFDELDKCCLLNHPDSVGVASNKLKLFNHLNGVVSIPEYTTSPSQVMEWVRDGHQVFAREKLTGHSGEGIVILEDQESVEEYDHSRAQLYTKYVKKKDEYRVHVFRNKDGYEVLDVQRKAIPNYLQKMVRSGDFDTRIRTHAYGYIFVRNEDKEYPEQVKDVAIKAIEATGLDFGAVDIIFNVRYDKAYVLEINTAPGLEGTTLKNYVEAFAKYFGEDIKWEDPLSSKKGKPKQPYISNEFVSSHWITNSTPSLTVEPYAIMDDSEQEGDLA